MVGFDVPVVGAFVPVAEVGVAEVVAEIGDDAALSFFLQLADLGHGPTTSQWPDFLEPTRRMMPSALSLRKW